MPRPASWVRVPSLALRARSCTAYVTSYSCALAARACLGLAPCLGCIAKLPHHHLGPAWPLLSLTQHVLPGPRRPIIGSSDRYPPSSPLPSSRVLHDRYPTVSSLQLSLNMYCSRSCSLTEAGTFRGGVGLPSRFEPNLFYFMLRSFYHFSPDKYWSTCRLCSAKRGEGCLRAVFEGSV